MDTQCSSPNTTLWEFHLAAPRTHGVCRRDEPIIRNNTVPAPVKHNSLESGKFWSDEKPKVHLEGGPIADDSDRGMKADTGQWQLIALGGSDTVPNVVAELAQTRKSGVDEVESDIGAGAEEFEFFEGREGRKVVVGKHEGSTLEVSEMLQIHLEELRQHSCSDNRETKPSQAGRSRERGRELIWVEDDPSCAGHKEELQVRRVAKKTV